MPDPPFHSAIGVPFIELQTVDSTNNYAFRRIHSERRRIAAREDGREEPTDTDFGQHGTAIFAHEQTSGKGQRGKQWSSGRDQNIALSIILQPGPLAISQQFWLSVCAAVALNSFFRKYAGEETRIKWPNDLYWKDRKAGGVLIESIVASHESGACLPDRQVRSREPAYRTGKPGAGSLPTGQAGQERRAWQWAVVGMGININQESFPPELPNPVSLKQITGKNFDTVELAKEICRLFNDYFEKMINGNFEDMHAEYLSYLYKINEKVKLKKDNRVFEAIIKGVSPAGKLVVQHGIEEEFDFGSIEWVL